jgi:hypothetical protein
MKGYDIPMKKDVSNPTGKSTVSITLPRIGEEQAKIGGGMSFDENFRLYMQQ